MKYYPIDEDTARRAHEMMSMRDYKPGSATAGYRASVDEAAALVERCKAATSPYYHDKLDALLDRYARRLAQWTNDYNRNGASCPSVLICGAANFPTRKKERQNAREDALWQEYKTIEAILDKIKSTGSGPVDLTDPHAREMLQDQLWQLQHKLDDGKAMNAYYRKHKTLEGCPALTSEGIAELQASMSRDWHKNPVPYPSFYLSNNNANIHRVEQRIHDLKNRSEFAGWEFPGGRAEINKGENRLQLFFDEKPGDEQRQALKHGGFRWSPSQGAWQRQLNRNAIYAADRIDFLRPEGGGSISALQPYHQKQRETPDVGGSR